MERIYALFELPSLTSKGVAHAFSPARVAQIIAWLGSDCWGNIGNELCKARIEFLEDVWQNPVFFPFISPENVGNEINKLIKADPSFGPGKRKSIIRLSNSLSGGITYDYYEYGASSRKPERFEILSNKGLSDF